MRLELRLSLSLGQKRSSRDRYKQYTKTPVSLPPPRLGWTCARKGKGPECRRFQLCDYKIERGVVVTRSAIKNASSISSLEQERERSNGAILPRVHFEDRKYGP